MEKQLTAAQLRQRKFLLVLPMLIIPFLTLAFWALGGGKEAKAQAVRQTGLNVNMPNAVLKDEKGFDKMSFYDEVRKDSVKLQELQKNDPLFFKRVTDSAPSLSTLGKYADPNEAKVYAKLSELRAVMQQQAPAAAPPVTASGEGLPPTNNSNVDRLEKLVNGLQGEASGDSDMEKLNMMLDKIIAIQHPQKDTPRVKVVKTDVNVVSARANSHGFFSGEGAVDSANANTVKAIVPETQTVVSGATVKLQLLQDIYVKGSKVPGNSFVYGIASLNGERLVIRVNSLRAGNRILTVSLTGYDMDGLTGIYVPGSIGRDAAKQSADEGINSIGLATLDPSLGAQAASAGIQAAKSLIGKKARLIRVTIPGGYQIFLQQTNE